MAGFTVAWQTLTKIPVADVPILTGDTEPAEKPEAATLPTAEKPMLVWVVDASIDPKDDEIENIVFESEKVSVGAKAFLTIKMMPEDAKADPVLEAKGGKAVPRLVFVSADLKSVKPIEGGSLKASEVWTQMKTFAGKHYAGDFEKVVKGVMDVGLEFDKLNKERKVLDDKEQRATEKGLSPADKKELDTKRADLDAREEKAKATRDKLWELKVKGAKS